MSSSGDPNALVICPDCQGRGTKADVYRRGSDGYPEVSCTLCSGEGRLPRHFLEMLKKSYQQNPSR